MRISVSILFFLFIAVGVHGQTLKGTVVDGETAQPLFSVSIYNLSNAQSVSTNEQGYYSLPAKEGDVISFSLIGYHAIQRLATPGVEMRVEISPLSVQLQEYILHPDYTPYQKDSVEMTALYGKELNTKPIKIGFNSANGGGFSGLIGAPVQKMSRSYKKNKKFKENFQKEQEQKYIDTRYTPKLVGAITSFAGDTLAMFMNTYPMEYSFARAATDLELKMWIRGNYKEYLKAPGLSAKGALQGDGAAPGPAKHETQ